MSSGVKKTLPHGTALFYRSMVKQNVAKPTLQLLSPMENIDGPRKLASYI